MFKGGEPLWQHISRRSMEKERKQSVHSVTSRHSGKGTWKSTLTRCMRTSFLISVINVILKQFTPATLQGIWQNIQKKKIFRPANEISIAKVDMPSSKNRTVRSAWISIAVLWKKWILTIIVSISPITGVNTLNLVNKHWPHQGSQMIAMTWLIDHAANNILGLFIFLYIYNSTEY